MSLFLDIFVSFLTFLGICVAVWQLVLSRRIAQSQFEDSIDQQYRDLAREIPVDALIGKHVKEEEKYKIRELIYNYLDLSNEQVSLRAKKRINKDVWPDWCTGIKENLAKPEFKLVWEEIKREAPGSFSFLEKLENKNFNNDPENW